MEPTVAVARVTAVRVAVIDFLEARCVVTVLWDATRATLLFFSRPPTGLAVGFGLRSCPTASATCCGADSPLADGSAGGAGGSPVPAGPAGAAHRGEAPRRTCVGRIRRELPPPSGWAACVRRSGRNHSEMWR